MFLPSEIARGKSSKRKEQTRENGRDGRKEQHGQLPCLVLAARRSFPFPNLQFRDPPQIITETGPPKRMLLLRAVLRLCLSYHFRLVMHEFSASVRCGVSFSVGLDRCCRVWISGRIGTRTSTLQRPFPRVHDFIDYRLVLFVSLSLFAVC